MTNPNDNAFPKSVSGYEGHQGLTKREYAAFSAMQGLCSREIPEGKITNVSKLVSLSVRIADSIIDELNKGGNQ